MSQPLFEKVAFIGLGLIGSSLARVIRAEHLANDIVASTRSQKTLEDAKSLDLISEGYADPVEAVKGADLVVLALPVRATQKVLEAIKPYLSADTIITDVGSTKVMWSMQRKRFLVMHCLKVLYRVIRLPVQNIPGYMQAKSIYLPITR